MLNRVEILGTAYEISELTPQMPSFEIADGLCERFSKRIYIKKQFKKEQEEIESLYDEYYKKTLRHEIIHAFLYESGLAENSEWGMDETLIDWIAIQFPKLTQAFRKVDAI